MAKKNPYQNNKGGKIVAPSLEKETKKVVKITATKGKDLRNGK